MRSCGIESDADVVVFDGINERLESNREKNTILRSDGFQDHVSHRLKNHWRHALRIELQDCKITRLTKVPALHPFVFQM